MAPRRPGRYRENRPDRLTNLDAASRHVAASWSATLPLDRALSQVERQWGSIDNWLSHAPADHRTLFATVLADLHKAIDRLDNEATNGCVERLLNGIPRIDQAIADAGHTPPQARFFSTGEIAIAASSDDGAMLRASGFEGRVYTADEMMTIAAWFEEAGGPLLREAKAMPGTITDVRPRTTLEEALDDEIPF